MRGEKPQAWIICFVLHIVVLDARIIIFWFHSTKKWLSNNQIKSGYGVSHFFVAFNLWSHSLYWIDGNMRVTNDSYSIEVMQFWIGR